MAQWLLIPHPNALPKQIQSVEISVQSDGRHALLHYAVIGSVPFIPPGAAPTRADDLWRTTCFELFLRARAPEYVEFNFSPSRQWAAYKFMDHRAGRSDLPMHVPPQIEPSEGGIRVLVDLTTTGAVDPAAIALSAVIEEIDGTKSFWALAHAPGPPDFHNPTCFTATLPASAET